MPSVCRETVIAAVKEYGLAWSSQDATRIGALFTHDAVYVERAFDRKATFRGREAIQKYWKYQICGKQSNISFRHVESEMVRDADQPIAVVKWLAEFDNHREKRADKANKRVRFCQMAKLIFKGDQIMYLEEYAQGMQGSNVRWPGLEATEEELWSKIRFEPEKPRPPVACERCQVIFPSRTKLFEHLEATEGRTDGKPGCVPNAGIKDRMMREAVWVCLSVSYTCMDPQQHLLVAFEDIIEKDDAILIDALTLTWAVTPELSSVAVVNVVTAKLSRSFVDNVSVVSLPELLNQSSDKTMKIHTAGMVDRPCAPERREFEKYAVYIPWKLLQSKEAKKNGTPLQEPPVSESLVNEDGSKRWRIPLEERSAIQFVDPTVVRRVKDAARLMRDGGKDLGHFVDDPNDIKIRVRTSIMEEPWHRFCQISVSMRQPVPGHVEHLIGLMVAYTRFEMEEDDFVAAMKGAARADDQFQSFPSELLVLVEPALTRYENKMGLALCLNSANVSEETRTSIFLAEEEILRQLESKEHVLDTWSANREVMRLASGLNKLKVDT